MEISDYAVAAKWFDAGTEALYSNYTIEADSEGASSVLRFAFILNTNTEPSSTTLGDGATTQHFSDYAEVRFRENGNDWQIGVYEREASINSGARTLIGTAVNYGNPNNAETYTIQIETRGELDPDEPAWFPGQGVLSVAVFQGGNQVLRRSLNAVHEGDDVQTIWIIGAAATVGESAVTAVDDRGEDNNDSTCIFDVAGTLDVNGDQGLQPGSEVPDATDSSTDSACSTVFCVDSTTVPEGFTAGTFNLFLGLLLMISIGVGVFMWTQSAVMGGFGFAGGFLIAFAFGFIPLWIIVAVVIVATAIIFVKVRGSVNGGT